MLGRPNLEVRTRVQVARVLFEGTRAVGVETTKGERIHAGEVILCGGAINSPQLLQLSGVGAPAHLQAAGVQAVHDLPGVGENLQDHLEVYVQYACSQPVSMQPALDKWRAPWIGFQWLFFRKGPAATNHFEAGGFVRSNDDVAYPNLMFHFLPLAIRYDGSKPEGRPRLPGARRADVLGRPRAGSASAAPTRRQAGAAVQLPLDRPGPARVGRGDPPRRARSWSSPRSPRSTRARSRRARRCRPTRRSSTGCGADGETALHPSCTCRMGVDELSVVDPGTMRVHGLEGLRVVDASVFPYVTNGNIYAPTMMVAEKAADLILGNTPLAPSDAAFYRHEPTSASQ